MYQIRVHGLGGQGAVTLVTWLARAGYEVGMHVQAFPFFGAERRGAPVKAFFRMSEDPIDLRSQVYLPDLLVAMSSDLTGAALEEGISHEGRLLVNAGEELSMRLSERFERDVYYLDATGIALELGLEIEGMPMVNLPLFGALAKESGAAGMDVVMRIIEEAAAKRGNRGAYEEAARAGFDGVKSVSVGQKVP